MSLDFPISSRGIGCDIDHIRKVSGCFPGAELDRVTLEAQMARHWSRKQMRQAIDGTAQAWFDYRMVHPVLRSHLFFHEYNRARARAYKTHYGRTRKPQEGDLYREGRPLNQISAFINTMLMVDEIGMPYGLFFDGVIEHLLQKAGFATTWDTKDWNVKAEVPFITHMQHGRAIIAAQELFEEQCRTKMPLPRHPTYMAENYSGTVAQRDCIAWLCAQARRREGNLPYVLYHLREKGYLHEREILRRFGSEMVKTVRAIVV